MEKYPIQRETKYTKEMLDNLENALKSNNIESDDYNENKRQMNNLNEAFSKVYKIREEAFSFNDIENNIINNAMHKTTVALVTIDLRAEILINKYFELSQRLMKRTFE